MEEGFSVWVGFGGRSSQGNRMVEMRHFCPRPIRIRVNRPIEPTRPC
uniref:Uncharacterized protein n=1 Tax=Nelumbo nucifera TaxID=4432 RepID=A0A822ZTF2_NELNU|nr:TPA_asm: hypothetical protein HUJ06_019141 [Nelumbo nucifera]